MEELICEVCQRDYVYSRKKGHSKTKCNTCLVDIRRKRVNTKAIKYKGGKCTLCGYSKSKYSLCFHHINPEEKEFQISGNWGLKWKRIQKELDKCVLLCANCHGEVHEGITKLNNPA